MENKSEITQKIFNILCKELEISPPKNLSVLDMRNLIDELLLVRNPEEENVTLNLLQEKLYSLENENNFIDLNKTKSKKLTENFLLYKADMFVLFTKELFINKHLNNSGLDNVLYLKCGISFNKQLSDLLRRNFNVLNFTKPYILNGGLSNFNKIAKVLLTKEVDKLKLKENIENLQLYINANNVGSVVFACSETLTEDEKEYILGFIKKYFKNIKTYSYKTKN